MILDIKTDNFNKAVLAKKDQLQKLSDEEEAQALKAIANYKAKDFVKELAAVGKLLGK